MLWPESKELQIVSGINLLTDKGQEGLEAEMKEKIPDIESVTHMLFFGKTIASNREDLETAVDPWQPTYSTRTQPKELRSTFNFSSEL